MERDPASFSCKVTTPTNLFYQTIAARSSVRKVVVAVGSEYRYDLQYATGGGFAVTVCIGTPPVLY